MHLSAHTVKLSKHNVSLAQDQQSAYHWKKPKCYYISTLAESALSSLRSKIYLVLRVWHQIRSRPSAWGRPVLWDPMWHTTTTSAPTPTSELHSSKSWVSDKQLSSGQSQAANWWHHNQIRQEPWANQSRYACTSLPWAAGHAAERSSLPMNCSWRKLCPHE